MRVNVEGLISWIEAAVPVKLLAHGQRGVFPIYHLVRQVTYCQVLETDVLKKNQIWIGRWNTKSPVILQSVIK